MKKIIVSFLFALSTVLSFAQTTSFTPTAIAYSAADLNRPGGGANQWHSQTTVNIPVEGTNTKRLDKYFRHWLNKTCSWLSAANTFNWADFDGEINDAINNRQKYSFNMMQAYPGQGQTGVQQWNGTSYFGSSGQCFYPQWLHKAMQLEANPDFLNGGVWVPNYNSPTWLNFWNTLNARLSGHIDSTTYNGVRYQDVINFVDISGYGDYGEWTNNRTGGAAVTTATLQAIIDATVNNFQKFWCVSLVATFDDMQLGNTQIPGIIGEYALKKNTLRGPTGWTRLSWGIYVDNYNSRWLENNPWVNGGWHMDTAIMNRYMFSPITGEPQDGGLTNNFVQLGNQMRFYHTNSFGDGNFDGAQNLLVTRDSIRAASKAAGARILITTGYTSTSATTGGDLYFAASYSNVNGIPCYDKWDGIVELRNGATSYVLGTSKFHPLLFRSVSAVQYIDTFHLTTVPPGTYDVTITFKDPTGYRAPYPLFITGQQGDGSYKLRTGLVVANGAPVAVAGNPQTITMPVNYVTLNGTGSTGTITSWLWTKISGPGTPTISSPTSSTTLVTSLVAGDYVFQLSINGGASTSQIAVTVNPPVPPATNIFTPAQSPVATTDNDNTVQVGQEVGVRFESSIPGWITGIRFYKTSGNIGVHTGELYTTGGTRLASAVITNESALGWQTARLSVPVAITAGTKYVAAIHSSLGYYVEDNDYFLNSAVVNRTLTAQQDGTGGASGTDTGTGQGLYLYTTSPAFPNQLYRSANYWVDVVFTQYNPNVIGIPKVGSIIFNAAP